MLLSGVLGPLDTDKLHNRIIFLYTIKVQQFKERVAVNYMIIFQIVDFERQEIKGAREIEWHLIPTK